MTILILILALAVILYAATTLYVLRAVRRAPIDERRDKREIGRFGMRLSRPSFSRGGDIMKSRY